MNSDINANSNTVGLLIKSVIKGALFGVAAIAAVSLITALALTAVDDPIALTGACGIAADFAGGICAASVAVSTKKQKPLPTSLLAGLALCFLIFLISLVSGCASNALIALGAIMLGSAIGALIPVMPRGTGIKHKKLKPYRR